MRTPLFAMIAMRALYLLLILAAVLRDGPSAAMLGGTVFLITLPIAYFGRRQHELYAVDAFIMLLFSGYMLFPPWVYRVLQEGQWYGIDKYFHFAGGAGVAWLAYITYRGRVSGPWLAATVLLAMLAIGAGWEVFEWTLSKLPAPIGLRLNGYDDAMMDLIADSLGGLAALGLLFWRDRRI